MLGIKVLYCSSVMERGKSEVQSLQRLRTALLNTRDRASCTRSHMFTVCANVGSASTLVTAGYIQEKHALPPNVR